MKVTEFIPKYTDSDGNEIEMKKDGTKLVTTFGSTDLMVSPSSDEAKCVQLGEKMNETPIDVLRAAKYQSSESTSELKVIHEQLKKAYVEAEKKYMNKFIKDNYTYKKVPDDQ